MRPDGIRNKYKKRGPEVNRVTSLPLIDTEWNYCVAGEKRHDLVFKEQQRPVKGMSFEQSDNRSMIDSICHEVWMKRWQRERKCGQVLTCLTDCSKRWCPRPGAEEETQPGSKSDY